jgi:hypothetical protein
MTYEELGARTKQKYPQYANVPDADLGKKIAAKYPEYEAKITKQGTLEKIGQFIAPSTTNLIKDVVSSYKVNQQIPQVNQASDESLRLAKLATQETDQGKKQALLDQSRVLSGQKVDVSGFSKDVDKSALNRGVGVTGELATYAVPQLKPLKGVGAISKIGNAAITGATIGAVSGGTQVAESPEERIKNLLSGATVGGLAGGTIQAGVEGLSAGSKYIKKGIDSLQKKGLEMYATTFKDNKTAQKLVDSLGGPEKAAKQFIDYKIPKTKGGVTKQISKLNSQYDSEVTKKLKTIGNTRTQDLDNVLDGLIEDAKKTYFPQGVETPKSLREYKAYANYLESFRGKFNGKKGNLNNLNVLRKNLDKTYQGVSPTNVVDGEKLANDMLANKIRDIVQTKAPITKEFFKKYSLLKKAEQIFYKEPKIGFNELLGGLVLTAAGGPALVGGIAARAFKSPGIYRAIGTKVAGSQNVENKLLSTIAPKVAKITPMVSSKALSAIEALRRYTANN